MRNFQVSACMLRLFHDPNSLQISNEREDEIRARILDL